MYYALITARKLDRHEQLAMLKEATVVKEYDVYRVTEEGKYADDRVLYLSFGDETFEALKNVGDTTVNVTDDNKKCYTVGKGVVRELAGRDIGVKKHEVLAADKAKEEALRAECLTDEQGKGVYKTKNGYVAYDTERAVVLPFRVESFIDKKDTSGDKVPLVIYLHGDGACGCDNAAPYKEAKEALAAIKKSKKSCVVLIPQTIDKFAAYYKKSGEKICVESDISHLLNDAAEFVKANYPIDETRIYLTGVSMGGRGVFNQIYLHPERYACGIALMAYDRTTDNESMRGVPMWTVCSEDDSECPISKVDAYVDALTEDGCKVKYDRYDNCGHKVDRQFYKKENWVEWMFAKKKES